MPFDTERYDEGHPSITPDGAHVVFSSDRTADGTGPPRAADEFYRVSRASGWTDVTRMTTTERISEKRAGVASDGTMYYWTYTRGEGMGFYRGQIGADGALRDTVDAGSLLFPNDGGENNPYIDSQQRFMLFATWGRDDGYGKEDLYLSTREGNSWSMPVNLGPAVNSAGSDTHPYVTPDGERLFLTSTRLRSPADTSDNWNHYVIRTDAVRPRAGAHLALPTDIRESLASPSVLTAAAQDDPPTGRRSLFATSPHRRENSPRA